MQEVSSKLGNEEQHEHEASDEDIEDDQDESRRNRKRKNREEEEGNGVCFVCVEGRKGAEKCSNCKMCEGSLADSSSSLSSSSSMSSEENAACCCPHGFVNGELTEVHTRYNIITCNTQHS